MGRERGNTFNQGADGELIECVEKSGFCDNILFPHSASAPPGFSIRTPGASSSPALSKDVFPGNLRRAPGDAKLGIGEGGCEGRVGQLHLEPTSPLSPKSEDGKQETNSLDSKLWKRHWKSHHPGLPAERKWGLQPGYPSHRPSAPCLADTARSQGRICGVRVALSPRNIWQCLKTFSGCHD